MRYLSPADAAPRCKCRDMPYAATYVPHVLPRYHIVAAMRGITRDAQVSMVA